MAANVLQVEVSVMLLKEELEEQGVPKEEIEQKAAQLRAKLVAEAEAAQGWWFALYGVAHCGCWQQCVRLWGRLEGRRRQFAAR